MEHIITVININNSVTHYVLCLDFSYSGQNCTEGEMFNNLGHSSTEEVQ